MRILKKLSVAIVMLTFVFTSGIKEANSQDLQFTNIYEGNYPLCSIPDTSLTTTVLYNYGPFGIFVSQVHLYYDFGDATSDTDTLNLTLPAGGVYVVSKEHIYTAPGIYTVTVISSSPTLAPPFAPDTISHVIVVSAGCGNLSGSTYIDNNANCIFDAGDDTLRNHPVYLTDVSSVFLGATTSDTLGNYNFLTAAGVSYNASVSPGSYNLATSCPLSGIFSFTATAGPTVSDFGFTCLPNFDATISAVSTTIKPGQNVYTDFFAQNLSCLPVSGTITLIHDSLLLYVSSGLTPASVAPGIITWNYTNLDFETGAPLTNGILDQINFFTDTTATPGDSMLFVFDISPTVGDINTANNIFSYYKEVKAAFDPNIKEVFPLGTGPAGNVAPETNFTYTVHFQNTGTASATDVKITDALDSDLDLTTFQITGSSHYLTANINSFNVLTAMFDNINLPDSTSDEAGSHGWFTYKVKAKAGLANGTPIYNYADIYFDFNSPITTNTTLNTIDIFSDIAEQNMQQNTGIKVYPNPSNTFINLKLEMSVNSTVLFIDMTGRIVMTTPINGNTSTLNVEQLPSGIYQVIIPGTNTLHTRFQKIK